MEKEPLIKITFKDNIFLFLQYDPSNQQNELQKQIKEKIEKQREEIIDEKKNNNDITLNYVFDINNLPKDLGTYYRAMIQELIIYIVSKGNKKIPDTITDEKINIFIKHCFVESLSQSKTFYEDKKILNLNQLFISDEIYSMSLKLNSLFNEFYPKILILKKIKINSKSQLKYFFNFISEKCAPQVNERFPNKTACEELILEDFFIELILRKKYDKKDDKKDDETYNELDQYITFENEKFYIIENKGDKEQKKELEKLKKLKMIDCPLFALSDDTFKNINNKKEISIEIDENSLLNPDYITKFKVSEGCSYICFDLDSYKINEDEENKEKDYINCLENIFNIIIDNENNIKFKKIKFKNFDITKYKYITNENLTFINEKNWLLNKEEKEKKKKFEEFDEKINKKINDNLDKLSDVKELIFDNCSNHFMQLILKFISNNNNNPEYQLDYLKIKKCGKEYFDLKHVLSLKIKTFILFDTPLIIDHFLENGKSNIENVNGHLGTFDNFTIKINSLEHYCSENNLDYNKSIEIIIELINNLNFNNNLCFELNALPAIMTFLVGKVKKDFKFESNQEREDLIEGDDSPFILPNLQNKTITIKNNYIKNRLENLLITSSFIQDPKILDLLKKKSEFESEIFEFDSDYKAFFNMNKITKIILKDNMFSNNIIINKEVNKDKGALYNLIDFDEDEDNKPHYKIDIKTLNQMIYNNNVFDNFSNLFKNFENIFSYKEIDDQILKDKINNMISFIDHLKKIFQFFKKFSENLTIIFDNLKEKKEFYCLLCFIREIMKEENYFDRSFNIKREKESKTLKYRFPDKDQKAKQKLSNYFLKKTNEEKKERFFLFNYYYTSEEEQKVFDESKKMIEFNGLKINYEYSNTNDDDEMKLLLDVIMDNC